ncbi:MAG: MFS transporter [Actinomycetota bacterium]
MSVRRRLTATLFGGAALGTTGYIAAVTVSALAVEEITGRATLAGLPGAMAIVGTAAGTSLLTLGVDRWGRRPGLVVGYLLGAAGATAAVAAVVTASVWLLLAGTTVLGLGHASNQLARYTGAELFAPERRATALSLIVWAGTIGSVLGPVLLEPGGALTVARGYSELAGGYVITFGFMAAAALLYMLALRPDPAALAHDGPSRRGRTSFGDAFRRPHVQVALAAMISGQVVMVLIMVATPLHIRHHGFDLGIVGLVMSAHTLGMFAFSPLTGRLADRLGRYRTVLIGLGLLGLSAVMAATAPATSTTVLLVALFLLGLGWNFGFVAGSALLTVGFSPQLRARLQGRADSVTWLASAAASFASGMVFEMTDYRLLSVVGLALLALPTLIVVRHRAAVATVPA